MGTFKGNLTLDAEWQSGNGQSGPVGTYYPENYGAVGDGMADDTAAIQSALDAAKAANGGAVRLTQTYGLTMAGTRDYGLYTGVGYALHADGNNIVVEGPGTLRLLELPTVGQFVILGFGNGGTDDPRVKPGDTGTWTDYVGCSGITIDNSAYGKAELQAIGASPLSGCIIFSYCRNFWCENNTIWQGFGGTGAITTHTSSKFGRVIGNRVLGSAQTAMWFDGARGLVVAQNEIIGERLGVANDINSVGVNFACNGDNLLTECELNLVYGNQFYNCKGGAIAVTGHKFTIANNGIYTIHGQPQIKVQVASGAQGDAPSSDIMITGNTITKVSGTTTAAAIRLRGDDAGYTGEPVTVERVKIIGNHISPRWPYGVELGESAQNNYIINNIIEANQAIYHVAATATGNVTEPNYP